MENTGHIKLYRSIIESQVFAHQTALKIWVWCLAKASYKERFVPLKIGKGIITVKVLPGQFLFGRLKAEEELGIDGSTIYKWIQKFASEAFDNMITLKSNNQYTVITLCNWDSYQAFDNQEITTLEQPRNNRVTTLEQPRNTNNKVNKVNKVNNREVENLFAPEVIKKFIPPTVEQVREYVKEKGYKIDPETFVASYTSKGWKVGSTPMKDWKAAVVTWHKREFPQLASSAVSTTSTNAKWKR